MKAKQFMLLIRKDDLAPLVLLTFSAEDISICLTFILHIGNSILCCFVEVHTNKYFITPTINGLGVKNSFTDLAPKVSCCQ